MMRFLVLVSMLVNIELASAWALPSRRMSVLQSSQKKHRLHPLSMVESKEDFSKNKLDDEDKDMVGPLASSTADAHSDAHDEGKAATRTVNERLLSELEEVKRKEKFGARSSAGKKLGLSSFMSTKTDEERRAAIEEARNLNGVNPVVCIAGSVFALLVAAGLWALTSFLAEYFALHPVESDVYFVQRGTGVFRNVIIGIFSLASGFFGVTGAGIFFLGVRVAYGVMKGELDPTPIKTGNKDEVEVPNVWELMMGQRGRRAKKSKDDDNRFGI